MCGGEAGFRWEETWEVGVLGSGPAETRMSPPVDRGVTGPQRDTQNYYSFCLVVNIYLCKQDIFVRSFSRERLRCGLGQGRDGVSISG